MQVKSVIDGYECSAFLAQGELVMDSGERLTPVGTLAAGLMLDHADHAERQELRRWGFDLVDLPTEADVEDVQAPSVQAAKGPRVRVPDASHRHVEIPAERVRFVLPAAAAADDAQAPD